MAKEFQEPEEKELDSNVVFDDFNPLDEAVNEKDYTKHNVKINPNDYVNDIPEPSFMPPPMSGTTTLTNEEKEKKPKEPFNPASKQMSTKDKTMASERVAEMIMTAYKWGNKLADNSLQFNERKINKMQMDGEIDLSVQVPISQHESISAGEFIQEFNEQSRGTIVVTQEFEDEVMPVLTDVLAEEGIHMSKKQELAFLFGKDIAVKCFMAFQSINVKKDTLKMIKELGQLQQPQQTYTPPPIQPTTPTATPQPTYTPPPMREHNPQTNVNDFVNEMTGGINPNEYTYQPKTEVPIPTDIYTHDESIYEEPTKPIVKILDNGVSSKKKGRGRPSKKK